ncbi:hypothetical protein AGOR_G00122580 [Albula goreensis]|uniref:Uncharacterized protein n=1 Tax=Albula goreensis TaxID=1534307 RepID=A0A8T3DCR2_9TELE|nr:hypothetical protein AGOR_G00122580 [Albula goreensis]
MVIHIVCNFIFILFFSVFPHCNLFGLLVAVALKAGSEGELYPQADSLGSSGSASTLASSVIEVEAGRDDLGLGPDEDITPPTLSITEEILQFINQSRAREGLPDLQPDKEQSLCESLDDSATGRDVDTMAQQPCQSHNLGQSYQDCSYHEDQREKMEIPLEQNRMNTEGQSSTCQTCEPIQEKDAGKGAYTLSLLGTLEEVDTQGEEAVASIESPGALPEPGQSMVRLQSDGVIDAHPEDLAPLAPAGDGAEASNLSSQEGVSRAEPHSEQATLSVPTPAPTANAEPVMEGPTAPKREAALTKSDRQIIEKIRNYYEAAEVAEGQMPRRNSFSHIPSGLVKESVSLFNVYVRQDSLCDSEGGRSEGAEPESPSLPQKSPRVEEEAPVPSPEVSIPSPTETTSGQSQEERPGEEPGCEYRSCRELMKVWKEKEQKGAALNTEVGSKQTPQRASSKLDEKIGCRGNNGTLSGNFRTAASMKGLSEVSSGVNGDACSKANVEGMAETVTIPQSSGRNRSYQGRPHRRTVPQGTLDGLPSQISVGKWSRRGQGTSACSLLDSTPDVMGIGLFEGGADPCLVENSEKILSKVQMLARMYSAKISSMKMPLHKRAWESRAPPGGREIAPREKQRDKRHQNPTGSEGCAPVSPKPSEPQLYGHVFVREQLSATYLQENGCVLAGPRESTTGVDSTSISPASSPTSPLSPSTQVFPEGKETETTPPQKSDSVIQSEAILKDGCTSVLGWSDPRDAEPEAPSTGHEPNCHAQSGVDIQPVDTLGSPPQTNDYVSSPKKPIGLSSLLTEQKPERPLYPIREDPPFSCSSSLLANGQQAPESESDELVVAGTMNQVSALTDSESPQIQKADVPSMDTEEENHTVDEGGNALLETSGLPQVGAEVESETLDDSPQGTKDAQSASVEESTESSSEREPGGCTVETFPTMPVCSSPSPPEDSMSSGSPVPESAEAPERFCAEAGCPETEAVSTPPAAAEMTASVTEDTKGESCRTSPNGCTMQEIPCPDQQVTDSSECPGGKYGLSQDRSLSVQSPITSPVGMPSSDHLPKFTSQRPLDLPTTRGRRNLPPSLEALSAGSAIPVTRLPSASLRYRDPIQDIPPSTSGTPPIRRPYSQPCLEKPVHPAVVNSSDSKASSAFPSGLRLRSPSPVRGLPPPSSPHAPSALTKSLAASCISQTITQSLAKRNARAQSATPKNPGAAPLPPSSASPLRMRSSSPKQSPLTGTSSGPGTSSTPPCSPTTRATPSPAPSPPPFRSQRSMSPSPPVSLQQAPATPRPRSAAPEQPRRANWNSNNNNGNASLAMSYGKPPIANVGRAVLSPDPLRSASHNRVARPFSASEPSSRVQSPSPSPSPSPAPSFTRICSPPPAQDQTGTLKNKPPNPKTPRTGGVRTFTPLCLSLERAGASSFPCSSPPCGSPRVTSPPPIGVPTNMWGTANPQPRKPDTTSLSPVGPPQTCKDPSTQLLCPRIGSSSMPGVSCTTASSQSLRRQRGNSLPFLSLTDRPPSPMQNGRRSWADSGRRSVGAEHEAWLRSPQSTYSSPPSCLSPGTLSPSRLGHGKGSQGGQHFTSIAWPDVRELLTKYSTEETLDGESVMSSTSSEGDSKADEDSSLQDGNCRSTLICAYVTRTPAPPDTSTAAPALLTEPADSSRARGGSKGALKTSYATTVNLQIAGSGRITAFSNAQVSLTQTLAPASDNQTRRRVSVNGCNLAQPQSCQRL